MQFPCCVPTVGGGSLVQFQDGRSLRLQRGVIQQTIVPSPHHQVLHAAATYVAHRPFSFPPSLIGQTRPHPLVRSGHSPFRSNLHPNPINFCNLFLVFGDGNPSRPPGGCCSVLFGCLPIWPPQRSLFLGFRLALNQANISQNGPHVTPHFQCQ